MDRNKPDKTTNMVKLTIKRADDSTVDQNWVCKSIDDGQESTTPMEMAHGAGESLPAQDENSKKGPEYAGNWNHSIPSYLEIEMKEGESLEQSWRISTENNSIIDNPTSSHETSYNSSTSINNALDLSASRSNQSDVTNVSNKSPPEAHTSHRKFLPNLNAEVHSAHGLNQPIYHNFSSMWSPNILPVDIQRQINPGDEYAMSTMGRPFTSYNFPMNPLGVMPAKMEKREIPKMEKREIPKVSVSHRTQDAQKHQRISYRDFNTDRANYVGNETQSNTNQTYSRPPGLVGNETQSNANQTYSRPPGLVGNESSIPFRNDIPERKVDVSVNTQPRNATNVPKRLAENSAHLDSSGDSKSVGPTMNKKSRDVPEVTRYCNICNKKFKSDFTYNNHIHSKKHLQNAERIASNHSINPLQYNLPSQPLPLPPALNFLQFQMWQRLLQAQAMTPSPLLGNPHQSFASKETIDSNITQNHGPETSKTNSNTESSNPFISQNFVGKDCYPPNTRLMNLPFSPTCSSQRIIPPPNRLSENSTLANSKNLETKAPNSSRANKDISDQIQPERFNVGIYPHNLPVSHTNNSQKSVLSSYSQSASSVLAHPENLQSTEPHSSRACKDDRARILPESLPVANSSKKNVSAKSVTHHQEDTFRVYHCMVCSVFETNSWQDLQVHIYTDRSRTPLDLIIPSGGGLVCKLCDFRTKLSSEMAEHCTSRFHMHRVRYYNHLREGGIFKIDEALKNIEKSFWVYCTACEYSAISKEILHAHAVTQTHQFNASCCLYIDSFNSPTEYYACLPCNLKTLTKTDLLIHARSEDHKKVLEKFSSGDTHLDPRLIFYCKELSEPPKISEQNAASTFIAREEKNEERKIADNLSSLNLGSASSTALQPQPVICFLCQQAFSKIGLLKQHLQEQHEVNEAGVKWIVSAVTNEDAVVEEVKSLPEKEITDKKTRKVRSRSSESDKLSAKNKKLKMKSNDIREIKGIQNSGNQNKNPNLNLCEASIAANSSQELHETDGIHNVDILDHNLGVNSRGKASLDGSLRQEFYETESRRLADNLDQNSQVNPRKRTSLDGSLSQEFRQIKGVQNVDSLNQNSSLNILGRTSSAGSLNQELHETVGEKIADYRDQYSQVNPRGKTFLDLSLSQEFPQLKGEQNAGNMYQNPSLNRRGIASVDGSSSQEFHKTEDIYNANNRDQNSNLKVLNSEQRLNSDTPQHDVMIENEAESDDDNILAIETDFDSSGQFSSTDTGSLISHSVLDTSIESNDSWSNDDIPEPHKRLQKTENPTARRLIYSPSSQSDSLDSEKMQLLSDCRKNLDFEGDEVSNSSTNNLEAVVGLKVKDDNSILVKTENSDCSLNCRMESNDCPNESEELLDSSLEGGMESNDCPNKSGVQLDAPLKGGMESNDCPNESDAQLDDPLKGGMESIDCPNESEVQLDARLKDEMGSNDCQNESEVQLDASLKGGIESVDFPNESEVQLEARLKDEMESNDCQNESKVQLDASLKGEMESNDCQIEPEVSSQISPAVTDPQTASEENIINIEISGVFSLRDHLDHSSKDERKTDDIDIYGDL